MSLHYKILSKIASCSLLWGMFFLYGCISPTEIKNPELGSVQITAFRIEDKDNPDLKNTFFSIDHRKGVIYNAHLLPKDLALDSVKVVLSRHTDAQLKFIVAGKEETPGSNDSLSFVDWKKGISIQLSNPTKEMFKEYKVDIRTYSYDPQTFNWHRAEGTQLPALADVKKLLLREHQDQLFLFVGTTSGSTEIYKRGKEATGNWQKINTSGLTGIVKNCTIAPDGTAYLLTDHFDFLVSSGDFTRWSSANIGQYIFAILGAFTEPGEKVSTLALVLREAPDNKLHFGVLKGATFSSGEPLPADFPVENFSPLHLNVAQHPMLLLVGSSAKSGVLQKAATWTTTSGLDWLRLPTQEEEQMEASLHAPALIYDRELDRIYSFIPADFTTATPQMKVYFSDNKGLSWMMGSGALMLPPAEFGIRSNNLVGYMGKNHTLYLFGGILQNGTLPTDIWKGTPRIYTE